MANLNIIKQDLLVARSENEEEIAKIDRVLQALGQTEIQKERKQQTTPKKPSSELLEAVSSFLRNSQLPQRNDEIAARLRKSNRSTGRALTYLKSQGKVTYERNNDTGKTYWRWVR